MTAVSMISSSSGTFSSSDSINSSSSRGVIVLISSNEYACLVL